MAPPEPVIEEVVDAQRYELRIGGELAGFMTYRDVGSNRRILVHTEILPAYEGRGLGGTFARHVLDEARRLGRRVTPKCPFVQSWLARHPEYGDLVVHQPVRGGATGS